MKRRHLGLGILSFALAHRTLAAVVQGTPLLHVAKRGHSRVYLFGFGEAKDDSWLTPSIRRAFESSSDLWLEVGQAPSPAPDAAKQREQLTHDPAGRSFFE